MTPQLARTVTSTSALAVTLLAILFSAALTPPRAEAATYAINITPNPPVGPGIGKIVMDTSSSVTVTTAPSGAMSISGGAAVFLAPGGGVSTTGTTSPTSPQMTVTCVTTGSPNQCSGRTINVTIQAAVGGITVSYQVSTVSCSACSWGTASGTAIVTLPIHATGDFTARFNLGMTVSFNPSGTSGSATLPFIVSAQ